MQPEFTVTVSETFWATAVADVGHPNLPVFERSRFKDFLHLAAESYVHLTKAGSQPLQTGEPSRWRNEQMSLH